MLTYMAKGSGLAHGHYFREYPASIDGEEYHPSARLDPAFPNISSKNLDIEYYQQDKP